MALLERFNRSVKSWRSTALKWILLFSAFCLCLYIFIIHPLGPKLAFLPGDLTDTRFNAYVLEHLYKYLAGTESSFWSAPFFYPFPYTIAFSDSHLGTGLFYSLFRFIGYDRETAFQFWFLLSFLFNFTAASYVLNRYNYPIPAVFAGAIFFTFSLPVLAQDIHTQLSYRFCVPISCYLLLLFSQKPSLKVLISCLFFTIWQFYISIYLGYFLLLLLLAEFAVSPFCQNNNERQGPIVFWISRLQQAWKEAEPKNRWLSMMLFIALGVSLVFLVYPYLQASRVYDIGRSWSEIEMMLPRWQSFLTADRAVLWQPINDWIAGWAPDLPMRWEHQMFIGLPAVVLILFGLLAFKQIRRDPILIINYFAMLIIVIGVLYANGFSFYKLLRLLPGINSIRAIARIILVLVWPMALLIAASIAQLLRSPRRWFQVLAFLFILLICVDSNGFKLLKFSKASSLDRLQSLRNELGSIGLPNPILFVSQNEKDQWQLTEIDGMMLAQDLNIPTLNGYSGFFPYGIVISRECNQPQYRLARYVDTVAANKKQIYQSLLKRVAVVGMDRCKNQSISAGAGTLPDAVFENIKLVIDQIKVKDGKLRVAVMIINPSKFTIPAISISNNPFRLSYRFTDLSGNPVSSFEPRIDLVEDVPAQSSLSMEITAVPPDKPGEYYLEMTALQEEIAWFHEQGLEMPRSKEIIVVAPNHSLSIREVE